MRLFFIFIFLISLLFGSETVFTSLMKPLEQNIKQIEKISYSEYMSKYSDKLELFVDRFAKIQNLIGGFEELSKKDKKEHYPKYLKELRELERLNSFIESKYKEALLESIEKSDKNSFEILVSAPLDAINQPRIRASVVNFYSANYPKKSIKFIDELIAQEKLEQESIQFIAEQEAAYEEHLAVLKRQEAELLKKSAKIGSKNSVLLVASEKNGNFEFEVENLNPFTVTLNVDVKNLQNMKSSVRLPFFTELLGKSKKKVFELTKISNSLPIDFQATYGWVRGSAYAVHDDSYIYQIPFEKGKRVSVSQGYNGGVSHKGLGAYAIDFPVPIGTPIYAARDGVVVAAEGSNNRGGFSPEYRIYANYIAIEHSDRTMANYYHLNHKGVVVSIGQKVKKGELIGYSGNTGYTSGPHLHFSVGKVDPVSMRRPMNMPIKMESSGGIITFPKKGDFYVVK